MAGRFSIDSIDVGPDDLSAQLPVAGQLWRFLPGPDRPDYFLAGLDEPISHRTTREQLVAAGVDLSRVDLSVVALADDGTAQLSVPVVVMAARLTGQRVHQGMAHFAVNIAYVLSPAVVEAQQLEFALCLPVAVGFIADRDAQLPSA